MSFSLLKIFKSADNTSPAATGYAVTTSNTVDLPNGPCMALYVGSGGDLKVITSRGDDLTFVAVQTGAIVPIMATRVYATGTSASSIVALY